MLLQYLGRKQDDQLKAETPMLVLYVMARARRDLGSRKFGLVEDL
jgi:hypothetical protein